MKITKKQLQKKYDSMSNVELCKELGISKPTLMKVLKDNNIKLKGSGNSHNKNKIEVI